MFNGRSDLSEIFIYIVAGSIALVLIGIGISLFVRMYHRRRNDNEITVPKSSDDGFLEEVYRDIEREKRKSVGDEWDD